MNKAINLNKLGVWMPDDDSTKATRLEAAWEVARRYRAFFLIVVLPTLLTALYYGFFASDQYQSEADFVVHSVQQSASTPTGLGQMLGFGASFDGGTTRAYSVTDYLDSHDAVASLQNRIDLKQMFNREAIDPISRLDGNVSPERLLKYYRKQVSVHYDPDTGITSLKVRAFSPHDAYAIASELMNLGEQRVNSMNARSFEASVAAARKQYEDAESEVSRIQSNMTAFRQKNRDIDPQESGAAQLKLVSDLDGQVAAARATLETMLSTISPSSPQVVAQRQRLAALQAQLGAYRGQLSGDHDAISIRLGHYEDLQLQQKFAAERYQAAAAVFQKAREDASKQQLFIARVVEANVPEMALYPKRLQIILTVAISLLLVYAIGWLIVAGVREHSA